MADYVVSATLTDGISSPADAAAAAMNRAADAADNLTGSVTKAGPSAAALVNRFDDSTRAARAYQAAVDKLAQSTATLDAAVASGSATAEQRSGVLDTLRAKVAATRDAMAAATPASGSLAQSNVVATAAAAKMAATHGQAAFAARQLEVQFTQMASGIATGQPIFTTLIQQGHQVGDVMLSTGVSFRQMGAAVLGMLGPLGTLPGLIGVATVGTLAALGYAAEQDARQLAGLQTALRATRDDFTAMGIEAKAAAQSVAATSGFGRADTTAAAGSIASAPNFVGTQAQLESLIRTAGDLAAVMGVTLPVAAKELAAAMLDPGAEADKLAKEHFPGFTTALADNIKLQQQAGDTAGAFGKVLDVVRGQVAGAADASKTDLQKALEDLSKAFSSTGADGKSFGQVVGDAVRAAAADVIDGLASMILAINNFRSRMSTGEVARSGGGIAGTQGGTNGAGDLTGAIGSNVLTSSAGALGIFQLMPGTAADMHVNPLDANQNIGGGLAYIQKLASQQGATTESILARYHGNGTDTAAAAPYIAKVAGADTSVLNGQNVRVGGQTMTVAQAIEFWGQTLGLAPDVIALGKQIATVESGGHQFGPGTPAVSVAAAGSAILSSTPFGPPAQAASGDANGMTNPANKIVSDALASADKAGTAQGASSNAFADIQQYQAALTALAATGDATSDSVVKLQQALSKAQIEFYNAVDPVSKLTRQVDIQTSSANQIAAAWANGAGAADHATNATKAQVDALAVAAPGTAAYGQAVATLTAKYDALTAATQAVTAGQQAFDQSQQLEYLQAETASLGESADVRARDLAVLKEQQEIEKSLPDIEQAQKDKLIANAAAISDATQNLQQQQAAYNEIGNAVSQIGDQIGQALSNAFVSGQGAAVSFGNVAKAVLASIIQEIAKLALINPILNSITGSNSVTLSGVLGAVGSSGAAGGSSGGGIMGTLSNLGTVGSIGNQLGLGDVLGLTGENGLLSNLGSSFGLSGSNGVLSGVTGLLGTPIFGTGALTSATTDALGSLGAGVYGPATASSVGLSGVTIGGALSGVGLGFGAGSLAGGFVQSALNKSGPAPTIGAGVGALSGAAIGSIVPGIGTVLGGLIGGILGGSGGGLIGPGPKNAFSSTPVSTQQGVLSYGSTSSQIVDTHDEVNNLHDEVASINDFLNQNGLSIAGQSSGIQVGQNTPNGFQDPSKFADLFTPNNTGSTAFSKFSFTANGGSNAATNGIDAGLDSRSFSTLQDLEAYVTGFQTLMNTTIPALENYGNSFGTVTGSLNDSLASITAQFGPAIDAAQQYGVATDGLMAAQAKAVAFVTDAAQKTVDSLDAGFNVSYLAAAASISGNPADSQTAALAAFDAQAQQQRDSFGQQLQGIYGTSYKDTSAYADQMAQLEKTLGEQRVAIQTQYNDQITAQAQQAADQAAQTATSSVTSLGAFIQQLSVGAGSPLSPRDQYSLARQQFANDNTAAQGGDFTAFSNLQNDASAFLSASQAINGSGIGLQADLQTILASLKQSLAVGPDALTASVVQTETRTQTQTLTDALNTVVDAINRQTAVMSQNSLIPARLAA